jgi:hypothetical protein
MHVQLISAPTDSSADLSDVDIGINAICYADLDNQACHDGYPIPNAFDPQRENQFLGDFGLKYLDPIAEVAKRHIPTFLKRRQGLLFSIYGASDPFLTSRSLLHVEGRNIEKTLYVKSHRRERRKQGEGE